MGVVWSSHAKKLYLEDLFNTVDMQKAVTEIFGVSGAISVAKVIMAVRNLHSNMAAGI